MSNTFIYAYKFHVSRNGSNDCYENLYLIRFLFFYLYFRKILYFLFFKKIVSNEMIYVRDFFIYLINQFRVKMWMIIQIVIRF